MQINKTTFRAGGTPRPLAKTYNQGIIVSGNCIHIPNYDNVKFNFNKTSSERLIMEFGKSN